MAKEINAATFFERLMKWQTWVEESLAQHKTCLEIARSKPEGAEHDSNLYMTADGTVWALVDETWCELIRSSEAKFAEYAKLPRFRSKRNLHGFVEKPDGTRLVFVKRSTDMQEDWGWQIRHPTSWPPPRSTALYYEESVRLYERGLRMAQALLEKREQIEEWMAAYAQMQGERRATDSSLRYLDWSQLFRWCVPGVNYTDTPGTDSLRDTLYAVLDQLALGRQIRE